MGLLEKFKFGLSKSSSTLSEGINNIFKKRKIDNVVLQEFEDLLISSDVGIETAQNLKNDFEKFRIDKNLDDHKEMPELKRIQGLRLSGEAFANTLMIYEFLHNFGDCLGFDMDSLPTLDSLQVLNSIELLSLRTLDIYLSVF